MENTTNIKIPKKYEHMLDIVEYDSDGYWAYSKDGFYFVYMGSQCHTAHEDTQAELLKVIRSLAPCECENCVNALKEKNKKL